MSGQRRQTAGRARAARGLRGAQQVLRYLHSAWRLATSPETRSALRGLSHALMGATQVVRTNSLRGIMAGEVALSQRTLNRWIAGIEPPSGIAAIELKCHPSRLVLVLQFERQFVGFPLGHETIKLPFEVLDARLDHTGGVIVLRLDRDGMVEERGFLRPRLARMLAPEAADLLESEDPLAALCRDGVALRREGDRLELDLGRYPPFLELMNRELPLASGRSLFPFRALAVHRVQLKEGSAIAHVRLHTERILEDVALAEDTALAGRS